MDPIADEFPWVNTYNYAENEPVAHIDLHGLQKWPATGGPNSGLNYIGEGFRKMYQGAAQTIDSWKASATHTYNKYFSRAQQTSSGMTSSQETKMATESSLSANTNLEQIFMDNGNNEMVLSEPLLEFDAKAESKFVSENSLSLDIGKSMNITVVDGFSVDWTTGEVSETQKVEAKAGNSVFSASIYNSQTSNDKEDTNENGVEFKANFDTGVSSHEFSIKVFQEDK